MAVNLDEKTFEIDTTSYLISLFFQCELNKQALDAFISFHIQNRLSDL
jgi:hypothetical protein